MKPSKSPVAYVFDRMAGDYDELRDLWYAWLFSRLHYFLALEVTKLWQHSEQKVLDVGCGTGFQSFLYGALGCEVLGIDISAELVAAAERKVPDFLRRDDLALFPAHHGFVSKYDRQIAERLRKRFPDSKRRSPQFQVGSALAIECPDSSFSHVNCCGSVLSLVDHPERALDEIARVLRPGGTFFIEVESRWNCDAFWPIIDKLLGGIFHYESSWAEALTPLRRPWSDSVRVEFPFGEDDDPVYMDLCLFTRRKLGCMLRARGLEPKRWRTIHSVTNLLPSTILDAANPSWVVRSIFSVLRRVEQLLPVALPGCSLIVSGIKEGADSV